MSYSLITSLSQQLHWKLSSRHNVVVHLQLIVQSYWDLFLECTGQSDTILWKRDQTPERKTTVRWWAFHFVTWSLKLAFPEVEASSFFLLHTVSSIYRYVSGRLKCIWLNEECLKISFQEIGNLYVTLNITGYFSTPYFFFLSNEDIPQVNFGMDSFPVYGF